MKKIVILTLLVGLFTACTSKKSTSGPNWEIEKGYIFEVEFENNAWEHTHYGYVVDDEGIIFRYDLSGEDTQNASWYHPNNKQYTQEELDEKFDTATVPLDTLDAGNFFDAIDLVAFAALGTLTDPEVKMADAGVARYKCYTYVAETEIYTEVLLLQEGDTYIRNTNNGARELTLWLKEYVRQEDIPDFESQQ